MENIIKTALSAFVLASMTINSPNAREVGRIGTCRFVLRNEPELDGKCKYVRYKDGGLHIKSLRRPLVLAEVDYNDGNRSFNVHWNGYDHNSYADDRVGSVAKKGSCFVNWNESLSVCAWDR